MFVSSFSYPNLIILHITLALVPGMMPKLIAKLLVVTYGALTVILNGGASILPLV